FGLLTLIGLVALGLFFGGHSAVELVGMEEVLLLLAGLLLLGVEVFVLPGFGVAGVLGLGLVLASLVMAMIGVPLEVSFDTGILVEAIGRLAMSIVFAAAMDAIAVRFLPRTRAGRDRKSTRLNSSHVKISYAVFCLKKKRRAERDSRTSHNTCT